MMVTESQLSLTNSMTWILMRPSIPSQPPYPRRTSPTYLRDKQRVTLLFAEYKTCSDYAFDATQEGIWEKYTPHPGCPHPHRRHLFEDLRALGWRVEGLNADGALGHSAAHDRMLPILVGHGGALSCSPLLMSPSGQPSVSHAPLPISLLALSMHTR